MPRPFLQLLLLVTLGFASSYYWVPRLKDNPDQATSARQESLPKSYIVEARSWLYNEQGALTEIMAADSVEDFPQRDESLMKAPRLYSLNGDDNTWSASASRGRFVTSAETLVLIDDVLLAHDQTGTRLESSLIRINLQNKTARSVKPVTITSKEGKTTADGMIAFLEKERVIMKPNVESIYAPPQP
jgi:lipopolysaccharide export system protein LptC